MFCGSPGYNGDPGYGVPCHACMKITRRKRDVILFKITLGIFLRLLYISMVERDGFQAYSKRKVGVILGEICK